jgi:hypothetical protein
MPKYPDPITVPGPDADWNEIGYFALSFNAYNRRGGSHPVGEFANEAGRRWADAGELPLDLDDLRTALFFEQRRFHHYGWAPGERELVYIRALIAAIHDRTGGRIAGAADHWP